MYDKMFHTEPYGKNVRVVSGSNIPIRKSNIKVIDVPDDIEQTLGKLTEQFRVSPRRITTSSSGIFEPYRSTDTKMVSEFLLRDPEFIDFVIDEIITKKTGRLSEQARKEIGRLLADPMMWDLLDASTLVETAGDIENKTRLAESMGFEQQTSPRFHFDSVECGDLRIVYSKEASTIFRKGWFEYRKDGDIRPAPSQELETIQPDPGKIIVFDSGAGVHAAPVFTQQDFDRFGGDRQLLTLSFNFDRLLSLARANLQQSNSRTL